ncbi:DNA polymerase delta small subunit [Orchesella cincta]|uniref:DNA polymerase delta small subunit n=1 Tax=Orchesella cincta TaxID=48709 RepID=A0A1D2N6U6_ORCCI|nr:DNA polymerase delta small subunit [Orchesella cincta]
MAPQKNVATKEASSPSAVAPGGGQPQGNVINLMALAPQQLAQLKQQVEQELNFYQDAIIQLKEVQLKMQESNNCLKSLDPEKKEMLVPVTGSMFVKGELEEADKVWIDVGTGYYVEKTIEEAQDYFKRKVEFLTGQIEKVQSVGREKSTVRQGTMKLPESESLLSVPGSSDPGKKIDRESNADGVVVDEKFDARKLPRQFARQYAHSYSVRLWTMRPKLEELIKTEWPDVELKKIAELCEFSQGHGTTITTDPGNQKGAGSSKKGARTSDDHGQHIAFREDVTVAITGTIFKYQPEKPSILQELAEEKLMVPVVPKTKFISDQDTIQLEDESTRVQLVSTTGCGFTIGTLVNGVICALKGKPNVSGKFEVTDVLYPTPTPKPVLEQKLDYEMIFVSGLELDSDENSHLRIDMLFDYLEGLSGCPSEVEGTLKKRSKVFFVGDTFAKSKTGDDSKSESNRTEIALKLDGLLDQISQTMDVFILPGENDPSEPMLPQVPLHRCVFPQSSRRPTFRALPNPGRVEIPMSATKGSPKLDIILSSGQNVKDALRNSETTSALEMSQKLLRWGHLCPTAPDTIPLHPGVPEDVFVIENMPHIFAVGNQTAFDSMDWKNTKIFTIPKFSETGMAVLLNSDLEVMPLRFQVL